MEYKYDPILCMNIPVGKPKVKDASWKAWTLYIDGKWVKSFTSETAPIKEAQKFMKENHSGKVGKLVRNTGSSSGYSISGSESRDSVSSVDKAIKACDRFTVWESDDEDIYVSYENGTYVLYVDGRPQADGNKQKMIQLAKQEERMRD